MCIRHRRSPGASALVVSFVAAARAGAASKAAGARAVSTKAEVASMASGAGVVSSRCGGRSSSMRAGEVEPPGCGTMEGWGGAPPLPPLADHSPPRPAVGFAGEVGVPCGEEPSSAGGEAGDRMKPTSPSPTRAWSSTEGTWTSAEGIYSGVAASVGDYSASALPARIGSTRTRECNI